MKLDSILLLAVVIPFIMTYRLSPGETPYWLFGLIFLGLLLYLVLDLIKLKETSYFRLKQALLWLLIAGTIGSAYFSSIVVRQKTAPIYGVHDIVLQLESAIQFFLSGQNPYAVTYFGTPLEQWHYSPTEINPALYHFVMPPFYLLFSLPFYFLSISIFGFFDGRMPLLFLFFTLLVMAVKLVKDPLRRLLFLILLAFNPATLDYFLEGRDDIFMFAFLFGGLYLLWKNRFGWAGIPLALAFTTKQSAWPLFPFYAAFLYFQTRNVGKVIQNILPFAATFTLVVGPFFLWDPRAFLESTIFYLSGNAPHSYPISGYGWGSMLLQWHIITDKFSTYPFWIWEVLIGLPLAIFLIRWQRKENTVQRLILAYGIFLFVFWYLSRYFNNSHLGYLSMVFLTAYFWPKETHEEKL